MSHVLWYRYLILQCENGQPDYPRPYVKVEISLARRPHFSVATLLVPICILSTLTLAAFLLRVNNDARLDLLVTNMLAYAVYVTVITDIIPPSENLPVICKYHFCMETNTPSFHASLNPC